MTDPSTVAPGGSAAAPGAAAGPVAPAPPPSDQRIELGGQPGVADLGAVPPRHRPLVGGASVLPELVDVPERPRPLWRRPAFVVSAVLTVLALGAAAVLLVLSVTGEGPPRVSDLDLALEEGNAVLTWSGDVGDADLFVVDGGEARDLGQLVRGETAWVPVALGLFGEDSCFVVRPSAVGEARVDLGADLLAEQGAQSACVADVDD